jgi:maltoporin
MKVLVKCSLLAALFAIASSAKAGDLEFHGYARAGIGMSSRGGNEPAFQLNSGDAKLRLGNEADWVLEPSFSKSFTTLEDKSAWGVSLLPAYYSRFDDNRYANGLRAAEEIPVSFKEFYFYGRDVPQLANGEIWLGRRYFDRQYLGAINDQFLEAQDGIGAGVQNMSIGSAKLGLSIIYDALTDGSAGAVNNRMPAFGAHVSNIETMNKDSNLQLWAHVYVPSQVAGGGPAQAMGYSASITHVAGLGGAGSLTLAFRFDQNAYTDQQNGGGGGKQQIRGVAVYGVDIPDAKTHLDLVAEYRHKKTVTALKNGTDPASPPTNDWMQVGFRTDTQLAGQFRFLLEAGYDTSKSANDAGDNNLRHSLIKVTPCLAFSGGTDPWSRPTFRLFYTYATWNQDGTGDVLAAWKDSGLPSQYANKTSGGTIGLQAEGWW